MSAGQDSEVQGESVIRQNMGARIARIVLALLLTAAAITVGVVRLLPEWLAAASVVTADGSQRFGIGEGMQTEGAVAVVTPGEGWSVRPALPDGLQVRSPDRMLLVTLSPSTDGVAGAVLAAAAGDIVETDGQNVGESGVAVGGTGEASQLRHETLASGLVLQLVVVDGELLGVIDLAGETAVLVRAGVDTSAALADYRGSLGELLEAVAER